MNFFPICQRLWSRARINNEWLRPFIRKGTESLFCILPGGKRDRTLVSENPHDGIITIVSKVRIYPKDISISRLDEAQTNFPGIAGFRKQALIIVGLVLWV